MKPLVLHGPAVSSSRQKLIEVKSKYNSSNIVNFEKGSDPKDILANIQTVSMFDEERLFILENPNEDIFTQLSIINYQLSIIFWFDHEVKKLPDKNLYDILFFPEAKEVSIFPLLDLLASGNKQAFVEFSKLKKGDFDTQYFIVMIFYMLRSLVVTPKNAPPFVKTKLAKQRSRFQEGELEKLYKFVLETDYKIKNGLIEADQAEFLLINKFI